MCQNHMLILQHFISASLLSALLQEQTLHKLQQQQQQQQHPPDFWTVVALIHVSHTLEQRMFLHIR